MKTTSSTSGNEPHGASGGPSAERRRVDRADRSGASSAEVPSAGAGAAGRGADRRRRLRFFAKGLDGLDGRGYEVANGQPEESLTRHQPISIPRMPQRGRECQCLQPGSPTSSLDTRTQR